MQVIQVEASTKRLILQDRPRPEPGPSQLLVEVRAAGVNRADILQRLGQYPPPSGVTDVLGLEISGDVVDVGAQVSRFENGDRVFGLLSGGAYARYAVIHEEMAMAIPETMDYVQAAAVPEAFLTAQEAIDSQAELQQGQNILIHAGGSGVGTAAIQLAVKCGANVAITAGSKQKLVRCAELGASLCIDYKNEGFESVILDQWSGVDVVLDFIGAAYLDRNVTVLRPKGTLVCIGLLGGARGTLTLARVLMKQLSIRGMVIRSRSLPEKIAMMRRFENMHLDDFSRGSLRPVVDRTFPFERASDAHQYMQDSRHFGKIVLVWN